MFIARRPASSAPSPPPSSPSKRPAAAAPMPTPRRPRSSRASWGPDLVNARGRQERRRPLRYLPGVVASEELGDERARRRAPWPCRARSCWPAGRNRSAGDAAAPRGDGPRCLWSPRRSPSACRRRPRSWWSRTRASWRSSTSVGWCLSTSRCRPRTGASGPAQLRDDLDYDHACAELDLTRLAERTPALGTLRISGCLDAVHAGLGALVGVESLELADLTLDGVVMGRIASLPRLRDLTLARVTQGAEPVALLARARLESLVLRDLAADSGWRPSRRRRRPAGAHPRGPWAGTTRCSRSPSATALHDVKLLDTRAGNFSLHQLSR